LLFFTTETCYCECGKLSHCCTNEEEQHIISVARASMSGEFATTGTWMPA
jgi:hypothetical protein